MKRHMVLFSSILLFSSPAAGQDLGNFDFGVGLGVVLDPSGDRVDDAELVNGVVRVNEDSNITIRPMLETHVFAFPLGDNLVAGPFLGVQLGSDQIIDSLGAGLMVGVRLGRNDDNSLNFGLGAVVDPGVKTLGDGISADQPLPTGETDVRFRRRSRIGILFMTSYGF